MLLIFFLINLGFAKASSLSDEKPVLQEITLPRKLVENQTIRLNCDLIQGAKPIRFSWFFNDEPIRENERLQIDARREDVSSLMIKGLSVEQIGSYKCVGANQHGSDQQTVAVYVNSKRTLKVLDSKRKLTGAKLSYSETSHHQRPAKRNGPVKPAGHLGLSSERISESRNEVVESNGEW